MRAGVISTNEQFLEVISKSDTLRNPNLIFRRLGDIHPRPFPGTFPHVKNIWIDRCDKNFVFYWIKPRVFPNLENLYLGSHPCEPLMLITWLEEYKGVFYLLWQYQDYRRRWVHDDPRIRLMDTENYDACLPTSTEDLVFEP